MKYQKSITFIWFSMISCMSLLCLVDLAAGLNTESIQPLLSNPAVVRELQQHLPSPIEDSGDPQERLRLTLTSPQFQQVMINSTGRKGSRNDLNCLFASSSLRIGWRPAQEHTV